MHGIPNFECWYTKAQERLRTDALAPHFKEMRNDMQKKGVNPLNQVPVEHLKEHLTRQLTESIYGHVMVIPHPTQKGNTVLVDALNACSDYFNSLVSLIYDAYSEFKYDVDPQWYYTRERFEAKGRSFLDAVVELGFPPELANAAPNEDEGWHVLRLQQPPCALNSMFYAYLGKIIEPPTQLV
ncbi:hypothetical protein PZ78_10460 [Vreelandella venusta]|nr:hypothetical protein PZ78_10460 [Halomonas hydrothermalis]